MTENIMLLAGLHTKHVSGLVWPVQQQSSSISIELPPLTTRLQSSMYIGWVPLLLLLIAATAAGCCSAAAAIDHEICQFVVLVEATSNFSTADETSPHSSDRRIPLFILGPLSPICLQRAPILLALPPLPPRRGAGLSCTRHVLD